MLKKKTESSYIISFQKIENLEPLVNLQSLWMGKNKIVEIEGLTSLNNLTKLSLQVSPDSLNLLCSDILHRITG